MPEGDPLFSELPRGGGGGAAGRGGASTEDDAPLSTLLKLKQSPCSKDSPNSVSI